MISIILTAYKEPRTIGKAVEQILKNNLKNYELIVDAPDKETLDAVKIYTKKNKNIILLQDEGKGKPSALNLAFKKAKGDVLVLTDGDVYVGDNSITAILKKLKDSKAFAVTGRPMPQESRDSLYGYWANFLLNAAHEDRIKRSKESRPILLSGYLFAMKKGITNIPSDALDDAFISGMIFKNNEKIVYEPKAEVYIKNPSNFKDWLKQKRRNTSSFVKIKEYMPQAKDSRSFFSEVKGFYKVFLYPRNIKEFFYSILLLFARLLAWGLGFWDTKIKKKEFKEIWKRIDSTK